MYFFAQSMLRHLKFRVEEEVSVESPADSPDSPTQSTHLADLRQVDSFLDARADSLNGINRYVAALVKTELNRKAEAFEMLVQSLNQVPLFWSAWLELARVARETGQPPFAVLGRLRDHWGKNFFALSLFVDHVRVSAQVEQLCYDTSAALLHFFPESVFLKNSLAMFFHNLSDYDHALEFFFQVLAQDPFRFENMDILSNILYVKERHNELGKLAIRCFEIDKYSPETCCVLGNYYSLVGEHTQAAAQFQRAIRLDRRFLAGYTLLGENY